MRSRRKPSFNRFSKCTVAIRKRRNPANELLTARPNGTCGQTRKPEVPSSHADVPSGHLEIPVIRRSRESGNPEKSWRWIPAYAGMTGFSNFPIVPPHVCSANGRISFLGTLSNATTEFQKDVSRDIRAQHHPTSIIRNIYSNSHKEPNQPTSCRTNNKYLHEYRSQ